MPRRPCRTLPPAPDLESRLLEERTPRGRAPRQPPREARAALQSLVREAELRRRAAGMRSRPISACGRERVRRAAKACERSGRAPGARPGRAPAPAGSARHLSRAPPRPDGRDRGGRGQSARKPPTALADAETGLAETDRAAARGARSRSRAAREARAGSQARHEAAVQRLTEITRAIAETLRDDARRPDRDWPA